MPAYGKYVGERVTRAMFEKNMVERAKNESFRNEVRSLITNDSGWNFNKAYEKVLTDVVNKLDV